MVIPDPEPTVEAMRAAARALQSVTSGPVDTAKALRTAIDALTAQLSFVLADLAETKAYEAEGAASIATWAGRELCQDPGLTRQMVRNAKTMVALPQVGAAAVAGTVSERHLNALTYAIKHIGEDEVFTLETPLLTVATLSTPRELFAKIRQMRAVRHPDALDEAWLAGMDKEDIALTRLPDGWHVNGFLGIEVGTKLDLVHRHLSVPREAGDDRSPAERRVDAFEQILDHILANELPTDHGIAPRITLEVTDQTLISMYAPTEGRPVLDLEASPVTLEGFGPVGHQFTKYLFCNAEVTPILVKTVNGKVEVLDAGDEERYSTTRQTKLIRHRQKGRCANPGCHHPIGHIHHVQWWSRGGRTITDTMLGLCRRCHTLVHSEQLNITGTITDGFTFTNARGTPLARAA